jgi:hypothetical protein
VIDLRHDREDERSANGSRSSEETALLPMLGDGWEAVGDGIYRFVGRTEAPRAPEPVPDPEELVEEFSAPVEDAEPADRKRKGKRKRFRARSR